MNFTVFPTMVYLLKISYTSLLRITTRITSPESWYREASTKSVLKVVVRIYSKIILEIIMGVIMEVCYGNVSARFKLRQFQK